MTNTYTMPSGRCLTSNAGLGPYLAWRGRNPFYGKKVSILGDSISTFEGSNPEGYAVFYKGENRALTGVQAPGNTWWGQTLSYLGAELLTNASYSGSSVCGNDFPAGCSVQRIVALQSHGESPDCIFVFMGINDWLQGVPVDQFQYAYDRMLAGIQVGFPNAKVFCATLCPSYIDSRPSFVFPTYSHSVSLDTYCDIIRSVAANHNCTLMDLRSLSLYYDSIDGTHPTAAGMDALACLFIRSLDYKGAFFLNCRAPEHDWMELSSQTLPDGSISRQLCCRRCAAHRKELSPPLELHIPEEEASTEFVTNFVAEPDAGPVAKSVSEAVDNSASSFVSVDPSSPDPLPGSLLLGRYRLIEQIRKESPRLYTVHDQQSNTQCLLAIYDKSGPEEDAPIQEALQIRKMDIAVLPALYDSSQDEAHCYIVWEALPAESLADRLRKNEPLPLAQLRNLAGQLAEFWSDLRRQTPPCCMRAMGAEQILIDDDGQLRCSIEGILPISQALSLSQAPVSFYRAPEEAADLFSYDVSIDVYHFGTLLLQMATACDTSLSPLTVLQEAEASQALNKKLIKIIRKCIQPLPRKRYRTTDSVLWDLKWVR